MLAHIDWHRFLLYSFTILVVSILLAGCNLLPQEEEPLAPPLVQPATPAYELFEVIRGDLTIERRGTGRFAPVETRSYGFSESGGRVTEYLVRPGQQIQPGDILVKLEQGNLDIQLKQHQMNLERAQILLQQTIEDQPNNARLIRLRELDLENARILLQRIQQQYDRTLLVSETAGTITGLVMLRPGDVVQAYQDLVTVSDTSKLILVYEATNAAQVALLPLGGEVEVEYRNNKYFGIIVEIPETAERAENRELQNRRDRSIRIEVESIPESVNMGEAARILIKIDRTENVLKIPRVGLRTYMGRTYVQVLEGESRRELDVEVGLEGPTEVEIRTGLQEGQMVILNR